MSGLAAEARKSNLLLEAQLLRAQGRVDEAASRFAEAAEIEQQLAESCSATGDQSGAWQHRFSAAGCWAQAGNFYEAIALGDELLDEPGLPPALRDQILAYTTTLRRRREQWSAGLTTASAGA